jgi:hypothetical protein
VDAAREIRVTGDLATSLIDDFDCLGVNHFHNLFDAFFDILFPRQPDTSDDMRRREKAKVLERAREVNAYRNAMSHPSEHDLPYRDATRLLDSAHRLLRRIDERASWRIEDYERKLQRREGPPTGNREVNPPTDGPLPAGMSQKRLRYHKFFTDVLNNLHLRDPNFTNSRKVQYDNWKSFSIGRTGFSVVAEFMTGSRFLVHLYIDTNSKQWNKRAFDQLLSDREAIEQGIGERLNWDRLDHRRASRVYAKCDGHVELPDQELVALRDWAVDHLIEFKRVFGRRVQALERDS